VKGGDAWEEVNVGIRSCNRFSLRSTNMLMNRLRGTVADRPIDSQVVQPDPAYHGSTMQQIDALQREYNPVQHVDVSRLPVYDKG